MAAKLGLFATLKLAEANKMIDDGLDPIALAKNNNLNFIAKVFDVEPLKIALDVVKLRTRKDEPEREKRPVGRPKGSGSTNATVASAAPSAVVIKPDTGKGKDKKAAA